MQTRFNSLEKRISYLLNAFPRVKQLLKRLYLLFGTVLSKDKTVCYSKYEYKKIEIDGCETFFGYYDLNPTNSNSQLLVHYSRAKTFRKPPNNQSLFMAVYDLDTETIIQTLETKAYNWQQGARLQWVNDDMFVYNDYDVITRRFISIMFSVSLGSEVKRFDYPVQSSHVDRYFISLNYQRLFTLREEYGYSNMGKMNDKQLKDYENDGLWIVDYASGESKLIVALSDVIELGKKSEYDIANHKINHVMISPDGEKFVFLHRYYLRNRRFDRLILYTFESSSMRVLADNGMISHCNWDGNSTVISYMRGTNGIETYWKIDTESASTALLFGADVPIYGDGHPSAVDECILTDTYPDMSGKQYLLLSTNDRNGVEVIATLYHGVKYFGQNRCDLHPRYCKARSRIFIDSVHSGKRSLGYFEMKQRMLQ